MIIVIMLREHVAGGTQKTLRLIMWRNWKHYLSDIGTYSPHRLCLSKMLTRFDIAGLRAASHHFCHLTDTFLFGFIHSWIAQGHFRSCWKRRREKNFGIPQSEVAFWVMPFGCRRLVMGSSSPTTVTSINCIKIGWMDYAVHMPVSSDYSFYFSW